mgnify:CR=1 FL=1
MLANDVVCLATAPVLIEGCRRRGLAPVPFLLGLAFALGTEQLSERARIVLGAGLLGGLTTFSGVMHEALRMLEDERTVAAAGSGTTAAT